jgi:flavodoxin
MRKVNTIKWSLKKVVVLQVAIRKQESGEDWKEYAVIKIGTWDDFDELALRRRTKARKRKHLTLMCFVENLFPIITEGTVYSFQGFVSFGYGTTFFCIERAFDTLGFELGTGQSLGEIQESLPPQDEK